MNDSSSKYQIIYDIMSAKDNVLNVKELCRVAGVSRSGYYAWLKAESKRRERDNQDQKDFALILEAYRHRGYDKGVRGIYMRLKHMGISMNQKKIRRLMRKYNLACPVRKQNPYRSGKVQTSWRLHYNHDLVQHNSPRNPCRSPAPFPKESA